MSKQNEKSKEINSIYEKVKDSINKVEEKKTNLEQKLSELQSQREKFKVKNAEIRKSTEDKRKIKESLISKEINNQDNNNFTDIDVIDQCRTILDRFIGESYNDEINPNMYYILQAENATMKKLDNYDMTFGALRQNYCEKHNLNLNEAYFTDEKGNIYLDDLNVKQCLFPLDNLILKDYKPIIKVLNNKKDIVIENEEEDTSRVLIKQNKKKKPQASNFSIFCSFITKWMHVIILIAYILLWGFTMVTFKDVESYNIINATFKDLKEKHFSKRIQLEKLIESIDAFIVDVLDFPPSGKTTEVLSMNLFSQLNRPFVIAKLIQKEAVLVSCSEIIYQKSLKPECLDFKTFNNSNKIKAKNYTDGIDIIFNGVNNNYNSSGYVTYFPLNDASLYYRKSNEYKNLKLLAPNTIFVQMQLNLFNLNMDSIILLKLSYERIGFKFNPSIDYEVFRRKNDSDTIYVITFIFAFLTFLSVSATNLIREPEERDEQKEKLTAQYSPYITKELSEIHNNNWLIVKFFKKIFYNIIYFIRVYFVIPNISTAISLLNIILSIICLGSIFQFELKVKNIVLNESEYMDLWYLKDDFDTAITIGCIVLLLFSFEIYKTVFNNFNSFLGDEEGVDDYERQGSKESNSLKTVLYTIGVFIQSTGKFSLFILLQFILLSTIYTYFIFGDFSGIHYRKYSFHVIKSITSMFRGSIDNNDYDNGIEVDNYEKLSAPMKTYKK